GTGGTGPVRVWLGSDLTGGATNWLDPKLAALGNYGGPTQTMPLMFGSPAINAGVDVTLATPSGVGVSASTNFNYISGLQPGQTYYYKVTAFNAIGETMPSAEVNVTIPSSPNGPYAAYIGWNAVSGPVLGYNIYRSTASGAEILVAS